MEGKKVSSKKDVTKKLKASKSSKSTSRRKQSTPKKSSVTGLIVLGKKFKMSNAILEEICHLQTTTNNLLPKLPFSRLLKEIFLDCGAVNFRIQTAALEALQTASEMYLVDLFEDSNLCALHSKRVTLYDHDMKLACQIRRDL